MSNSLQLYGSSRTSTLSSGLFRTYFDVGFSPGASPTATVKLKEKDNPLIQQRCSSSSHVLDLNNYPDNSNNNNFFATTLVSHRRTSRTFKPYVRPAVVGVKKVALETDEALFGPVPTLTSYNSQATYLYTTTTTNSTTTTTNTSSFTQTPPIETSIFDFEEIDEKINDEKVDILDDEMVFEELEWITNTMNSTNSNIIDSDLPLSPPLSPTSDVSTFDETLEPLDDYVLFP